MALRLGHFLQLALFCFFVHNVLVKGTQHADTRYEVIIVGAGAAGIAAGTKLLKNNVTNILVLEARDRIGGRILTTELANNPVDLGCEHITGEKGNVIYETVKEFDIYKKSGNSVVAGLDITGEAFDSSVMVEMCLIHEDIMNTEISDEIRNQSLNQYFINRFHAAITNFNLTESEREIMTDIFLKLEGIYNAVDPLGTSMQSIIDYHECEGDQLMTMKTGFAVYLDILMGKYPEGSKDSGLSDKILLNKEVTRLSWGEEGAEVVCSDGTSYSGKRVILTLPLGVLQTLPENFFHPPLPPIKQEAIQAHGYGTTDIILMAYDEEWWPDYIDVMLFGMNKTMVEEYKTTAVHGMWPTKMPGFYLLHKSPLIVETYVFGVAAEEMELRTVEQVADACTDILNRLIGNETFTVPKPTSILRSKWSHDQYAKGAYSYGLLMGKNKALTKHLGEPLLNSKKEPVVLFAGEATHPHYFSTAHGAVESGWKEANRVLKLISK